MATHECGGEIHEGGYGDDRYQYCERCRAYVYDTDPDRTDPDRTVPNGTDRNANTEAFELGHNRSPSDAETTSRNERRLAEQRIARFFGGLS